MTKYKPYVEPKCKKQPWLCNMHQAMVCGDLKFRCINCGRISN